MERFHSPLLGCVLFSRRKQNKKYTYYNHWIRQKYCRTHKLALCFCGWEYGWHHGEKAGEILDPAKELAKPVLQYYLDGTLKAEYPSMASASRIAGITHVSIRLCVNGRIKMAGGYIWKLKEVPEAVPSL
jgi:hypothetical protein